jgi:hypothetical protein
MTITTIISTRVKPSSRRLFFLVAALFPVIPAKAGIQLPFFLTEQKAAGFPLSRD